MKYIDLFFYKRFLYLVLTGMLLSGCAVLSDRQEQDFGQMHDTIFSALDASGIGLDLLSSSYYITVRNQSDSWELLDADYTIPTAYDLDIILDRLTAQLESQNFTVQSLQIQKAPPLNRIKVEVYHKHLLIGILSFRQEVAGYMAIIIDDAGHNTRGLSLALRIDRPITFAVLPHLAKSKQLAEVFNEYGQLVMLHQPMAPHKNLDPGPGAISANMPAEKIRKTLTENLASVPHAKGLNNHMGSLITSDKNKMHTILSYLKNKNIFFLDSITGKSICADVAATIQYPIYKRDVFIDNKHTKQYIHNQLDQLITMTLRHKRTIGIGHFYPITLECILEKLPELDKKHIKLVHVSDLQPGY